MQISRGGVLGHRNSLVLKLIAPVRLRYTPIPYGFESSQGRICPKIVEICPGFPPPQTALLKILVRECSSINK